MKKINQNKKEWIYSETVKKHFFNPRNILLREPESGEFDAEGIVGSPACGDVMKMWIKIDPKTERIKKLKWRTFGCATRHCLNFNILYDAYRAWRNEIGRCLENYAERYNEALGGLPPYKIHCSVLADQAFNQAAENYLKNKNRADERPD